MVDMTHHCNVLRRHDDSPDEKSGNYKYTKEEAKTFLNLVQKPLFRDGISTPNLSVRLVPNGS